MIIIILYNSFITLCLAKTYELAALYNININMTIKKEKRTGGWRGGGGKYCKRIHLHGYEPVNRNNKAYMTSVMEMQSCGSAAHTDFTVIQSWENPDGIKA